MYRSVCASGIPRAPDEGDSVRPRHEVVITDILNHAIDMLARMSLLVFSHTSILASFAFIQHRSEVLCDLGLFDRGTSFS